MNILKLFLFDYIKENASTPYWPIEREHGACSEIERCLLSNRKVLSLQSKGLSIGKQAPLLCRESSICFFCGDAILRQL